MSSGLFHLRFPEVFPSSRPPAVAHLLHDGHLSCPQCFMLRSPIFVLWKLFSQILETIHLQLESRVKVLRAPLTP